MIPSVLSKDIESALKEFIVTGYETETPHFKGKFAALMESDNNGEAFFKGPYVNIGLPFLKNGSANNHFFKQFATEHSPFAHQETAWMRLTDQSPLPTLVATGTGSGKTECFLYPLLNHCLSQQVPGVKAIIIYPMNALATDQAKRFAEVIHDTPELKGKINVGLFVGGEEATEQKTMGASKVITCKETQRKNPPDILLTNYKMLDYLLMRPKDQQLWRYNTPETLRYLVVDELHTFDGAQGSDLAMLIRRLKAHLKTPFEHLVPVGTSATIGSDEEKPKLVEFISKIFDADFREDAIIGETRQSADNFKKEVEFFSLSFDFDTQWLSPNYFATEDEYIVHQAWLFFGKAEEDGFDLDPQNMASRAKLGQLLKQHALFHRLLAKCSEIVSLTELVPESRQLPPHLRPHAQQILISLLALVAFAKGEEYPGQPFVSLRFQFWARELKRIVASVSPNPDDVHLFFSDDLRREEDRMVLPVVQCAECHTTSWLAAEKTGDSQIETDLRTLYNHFFANDVQSKVLMPLADGEQASSYGVEKYLCSGCGHLSLAHSKNCTKCGCDDVVRVFEAGQVKQVRERGVNNNKKERSCPMCQANNSLVLFGSQAASLTSVAVNQLFSNRLNHDKKLIVFSDSVQDAAHRAGFYSARTWDMNIRMAMSQYLHRHGEVAYLTFLSHWFDEYTLSEQNPNGWDDETFISQFIAPNLESEDIFVRMKKGLKPELSTLLSFVKQRLTWESLQEIGIRSQIGRSLDRTGTASLCWHPDLVNQSVTLLISEVREKLGSELPEQKAKHLLWGVLLQLKRRGAIFHRMLEGFVNKGGDYFNLSSIPFLPRFGKHSTLPRFPASESGRGFELVFPKSGLSWYIHWLKAIVRSDELVDNTYYAELFKLCMKSLEKTEIIKTVFVGVKGTQVWGLNPEILTVTTELHKMELIEAMAEEAGTIGATYVPSTWVSELTDLPSMVIAHLATGRNISWQPSKNNSVNFYKNFYLQGEPRRVIGHEHTGLLSRELRENVENRFKAKPKDTKPWYENLLSATPTLEMGIDIGDLSAVFLASVPPNQASYLQRIGRAGRKTGNATVLTIANGQPHDLYFYANPMQMMAGAVEPPAIFLEATMVLRRQLLAFCFDDWGRENEGKQVIPSSMQPVVNAVKENKTEQFPYTLIHFIRTHRDRLWDDFSLLLPQTLTDEGLARLKHLLINPEDEEQQVEWILINRLKEIVAEVARLDEQRKVLDAALKKAEKKPDDEVKEKEVQELNEELSGVNRLKMSILKRETLNFLTDEGLLPNYAFPEEGTTLKSVIFRRSSDPNGAQPFESDTYEYSRPAHSAISELAPNSVFYASNHKVSISRVETARGKAIESIRICPSCSYSEKLTGGSEHSTCPRCGTASWAGIQQKFPVLRLTQVYANTSIKDATLGDDKDTREPIFFNKQMLVDIDPDEVELAYAFKDEAKPFGFEFVRKANFIEVNFGESTAGDDRVFYVAGRELERPGFRVCRDCGTVQPRNGAAEHRPYCKYAKAEGDEGIEQCLYLYREYTSEAIRIMMPNMSLGSDEEQTNSFVAAMQLGLKKRFGGKVDHLQIMVSDHPVPNSDHRDKYLVIYDSVPGGTGYLHELLADPVNLLETFKAAQTVMAACECQNAVPEVDGCYSCLYAYRNSYGMESTSRVVALNMLSELLDGDNTLEPVSHLGKVKKHIWEDSQLEVKFPEALKALNGKEPVNFQKVSVKLDLLKGKKAYHLTIGEQLYRVELHVKLGKADGVSYPCEPDYVVYPVKTSSSLKPIAIFLDGYEYHFDKVHDDLLKRQSLLLSGKYWVWSLSWFDLDQQFAANEAKLPSAFKEKQNAAMWQLVQRHAGNLLSSLTLQELKSSNFNLLAKLLATTSEEEFANLASLQILALLDPANRNPEKVSEWQQWSQNTPAAFQTHVASLSPTIGQMVEWRSDESSIQLGIAAEDALIQKAQASHSIAVIQANLVNKSSEQTKQLWLKLWQLMNWVQFIPNLYAGDKTATENGTFAQLSWESESEYVDEQWMFAIEEALDEAKPLMKALAEVNVALPIQQFELVNDKGAVIAEAELCWPDSKIVVLLDEQMEEAPMFEKQGYTVLKLEDEYDTVVAVLKDRL